MQTPRATIFLVDDDTQVRTALGRLLRMEGYDVRPYASGTEFLAAHDPQVPGCAILDLAMPGRGGLEVQSALAASGSRRPVLFLTGEGSVGASVRALRAGAIHFLTKPVDENELLAAVDEAVRLDAAHRNRERIRSAVAERLATLTPREREVLSHVVTGRLNKQIAADLGTVEKTIKVHRARAMRKMGARSLAELIHLAASLGITGAPASRDPQASFPGPLMGLHRPGTQPVKGDPFA